MPYSLVFLSLFIFILTACEKLSPEQAKENLFIAAESGNQEQLSAILPLISNVDLKDACYWTPLMKAALNGHLDTVRQLIDKGADVNQQDKGGYTALMLAASNNFADVVELLLQAGADINHVEQTNGWTALIWAITKGHTDMAVFLLDHHADVSHRGLDRKTAADWARAQDLSILLSRL